MLTSLPISVPTLFADLFYLACYISSVKMRLLMSSENPNIIKSIATYLYHPFQKT